MPLCVSSTKNITLSDWAPKPALVEFLDPISTTGLQPEDAERIAQECHELMKAKIEEWLRRHQIEYDRVWDGPGKPPSHAYIDDKGVACRPEYDGQKAFTGALPLIEKLCE